MLNDWPKNTFQLLSFNIEELNPSETNEACTLNEKRCYRN